MRWGYILLNRIGSTFDKATRIIIIQSLTLSLINYCIRIWGTTYKTLMSNVQQLQIFVVEVAVGGARKYDHVTPFFFKWLKVKERHMFDIWPAVYKALRGSYPDWLFSFRTVEDSKQCHQAEGHLVCATSQDRLRCQKMSRSVRI